MYEWLNMIVLAIVQGLTEFLPVSSSGHLVICQHLLGTHKGDVFFDIVLHCGTLVSVMIVYRRELLRLVRFDEMAMKYILCLAVGTLPAVLVGLLAKDFIIGLFHSPVAAGGGLLVTTVAIFSTKKCRNSDEVEKQSWEPSAIPYFQALAIGVAQALAIFPGVSRSGMTITASLWLGLGRADAARFSFLLSIPAITGALVLQLSDGVQIQSSQVLGFFGVAIVSCLVGLLALRWTTLAVIQSHFWKFGGYCLVLGLGVIFFLR